MRVVSSDNKMTEKAHLERKILLEINQKKKTTQETNAIVHLTDHSFIFLIRFRSMKPMNTCAQVDRHYFLFPTESINFTVHIRFSLFFIILRNDYYFLLNVLNIVMKRKENNNNLLFFEEY